MQEGGHLRLAEYSQGQPKKPVKTTTWDAWWEDPALSGLCVLAKE